MAYDRRKPNRQHNNKTKQGTNDQLVSLLRSLNGSSYGAYKRALGTWDYKPAGEVPFQVVLERIQADPYAPPSAIRIITTPAAMGLPENTISTADQALATGDFLVRAFRTASRKNNKNGGYSALSIAGTTPEILGRSAAQITPTSVELRIQVQLPARGRTIQGHQAANIFAEELPTALQQTLNFHGTNKAQYLADLVKHVHTLEDHRALTRILDEENLVAFVNNGALLPRRSGISQQPLVEAVPFSSPSTLEKTVTLPHAGEVVGMAIPPGITLIVGGGYHGKSTVLDAIQRGVYPHIPGDGRELVATTPNAMKIRAADGRPVTQVDVSPFINHLPTGANTTEFSTQNASGSTSQSASIVEALGVAVPLLLIDEDTSATNLMIRDERMRALVTSGQEPITPLIDRVQALAKNGTSLILVMGGSGAYLDVADLVLQMDSYQCEDVTEKAHQIAREYPREETVLPSFPALTVRNPVRVTPGKTAARPKTRVSGTSNITIDKENVDVSDVEQIVDPGQTEAIAWALRGLLQEWANSERSMAELVDALADLLERDGLDALVKFGARKHPAFLVEPRSVDVAAAINRYRALKIAHSKK